MSKIIVFNLVTLEGFFAGKSGALDWHNVDREFQEFAAEQLDSAGILLFGRVTYELMASFWPTPTALTNDPVIARKMSGISKIVFSRTMDKATWNNTRVIKENIGPEIKKLKEQSGKDIFIFGSADLISTFRKLDLIDEYRIMICPVILGEGIPLFKEAGGKLKLKLISSRTFHSGNVLLVYE